MQLAARLSITAGVALVGASVVAVTPMAAAPPGLPDLQARAVKLTTAIDPISCTADDPVLRRSSVAIGLSFPSNRGGFLYVAGWPGVILA